MENCWCSKRVQYPKQQLKINFYTDILMKLQVIYTTHAKLDTLSDTSIIMW